MPKDYDVEEAFRAIENELLNSMMKNLSHHRAEETKEGYNWTSWQAEQLKALNIYKQKNSKKFNKQFRDINDKINKSILLHRKVGATDQEKEILEAIKKGAKLTHKAESTIEGAFFRINDRKLDALLNEVNGSMRRAETAMLRMANDQYRKAIFNAQVYFNTGAGTYEKAVDMATKDYLGRGINCIQYKNGARVNIASYAAMALRTANTRAYLQGEGAKRQEWGISTVVVHKRGLPCPKCANWTGKILIDDVWSGGKASDGPYPLMSQAIAGGLYHPNCKDGHSTYFPGISDKPEKVTKKEMKQAEIAEKQENRDNLIQRNIDKFDRLSNYSLDEENQKKYSLKKEQWEKEATELKNNEEYQSLIKKRRDEYKRKHSVSFDRDALKKEINENIETRNLLKKKLKELGDKEKELTQKVYFDMTGTQADIDDLKALNINKKKYQNQLEELKGSIFEKTKVYKTETEKRILNNNIVEEIKLPNKITPDTADQLEQTLTELKENYGIMPKGVVYDPLKVSDGTATYNWLDDKIYISNKLTDIDKYSEVINKSESSLKEYQKHHKIKETAKETIAEAEKVLADSSIKGYEREKAILSKAEAEIKLNTNRQAVRENVSDVVTHEYGHFVHRHAEVDFTQKKNVFGAKELGGKYINGDWHYDINTKYSREAKIEASKISKYATESPYETFAEGFLAMDKGEQIPESIEKVINEAKEKAGVKEIAKENVSDIMNVSKEEKLAQYIGKPIVKTDNQSIREWYYANAGNIPNVIDKTQPLEEQVKQAFELRNQYKHEARIAMSDRETAEMLEKKRPAKTFEELVADKMKRKEMSREEALKDILETASKTNADVNKEFGL
ncbi:phage minor capsid protein [uncultured Eubacterium sp.]|uniref:phage minor capsid protein n=1 Tax=uncultured Eubacterium sp. TaxID=165185 RepID=UPI00267530AF|nr:phage minor capsid protein [uncultured Eubacterium sp.]